MAGGLDQLALEALIKYSMTGAAGSSFLNPGSFTKNTTNGQTKLLVAFSNAQIQDYVTSPTVAVNSGTIEFAADADQAGQFIANGPGSLLFDRGVQTFTAASQFSGTGSVTLSNIGAFAGQTGAIVSIAGPAFTLGGFATLSSSSPGTETATYIISSAFTWSGGSMQDAVVTASGSLSITGNPMSLTLTDSHLATTGQTTWDATCDITMISSTIGNFGTFQVENGATIADQPVMGQPASSFGNDDDGQGHVGTVTKLAGNPSTFNVAFNNSGTLDCNGFSVNFGAGITQSGANSVTDLGGGVLTASTPFNMTGGELIGPGKIAGSINMGGALLFSGATGTLTVTGDFDETSNASIQLRIGGNQANQYDQINVTGTANLDGQLNVTLINNFTPAPTDQFQVLTAGTARDDTWTVELGWTAAYGANTVTLLWEFIAGGGGSVSVGPPG